jgi:ATP-binding protein involved in chromosome partitioning
LFVKEVNYGMTQEGEKKGIIAIQADLSCDGHCESCERFFKCKSPEKFKIFERRRMSRARDTMAHIKHKIAVCAGKGGVGKSTVTTNISAALAMKGRSVSILDQDLDGSCIPRMMGILDEKLTMGKAGIKPVDGILGTQIIALANIIAEEDTNTWFHELRRNATEEFIAHVQYGERDYLMIDLPPGTSSDAINLMQYIPDLDGMIIVTVPAMVSQIVARRATIMAIEAGVGVLGVIENMSGYVCPNCGGTFYPMLKGGGERLSDELEVPFLGRVVMDPIISNSTDIGLPFVYAHPESPASKIMQDITDKLEQTVGWQG